MPRASAPPRRLIVAITGATGAIYGVRLLEAMRRIDALESHLVVSSAGWLNVQHELGLTKDHVHRLADVVHRVRDVGASIASGSFSTDGMIVAPCSMKTLASFALGLSDILIARAADVAIKEGRRLGLLVRETPLNLAHLRNMTAVTARGGIVCPPLPAFYNRPASIDDIVNDTVARVLDMFALGPALAAAWPGLRGDA